jgi:4-hydroxybenzoyl-CoA thioesterase
VPFRTSLTVRFGDVDLAGFVYYPRLVHYCHVAMEDFFARELGLDYARFLADHRQGLPTVHLEADFRRPLHYGDRIEIEVFVERLGESSVHWLYRLRRDGGDPPAAELRVVTANMDAETRTKRPLPDWLRERLERWVEPPS